MATHEKDDDVGHREVESGRPDTGENEDSGGVLAVMELLDDLVPLFKGYLAVNHQTLHAIKFQDLK